MMIMIMIMIMMMMMMMMVMMMMMMYICMPPPSATGGEGGGDDCQLFAYTYVLSTMYVHMYAPTTVHRGGEDTFGGGEGGGRRGLAHIYIYIHILFMYHTLVYALWWKCTVFSTVGNSKNPAPALKGKWLTRHEAGMIFSVYLVV